MDIFNKIGKSISDGGRTAVQKTKDMTEIAKRNSSISDAQQEITACYQRLGARYYQRCIAGGTDLNDSDVQRIRQLHQQISQWQGEITQLKGIVKCPACGGEVQVDSPFCQHCGAAMRPAVKVAPEGAVCPSCGATVAAGVRFCPACGKPMRAAPADAAAPAPEKKICPACGNAVRAGDAFCLNCGTAQN